MERIPSLLDSPILIGVSIPHKIDPLWRHRLLGEVPPQVLHVHLEQTRLETEMTLDDREELMKRMLVYSQADLSKEDFHEIDSLDMGPDPTEEGGDDRKKKEPAYRKLEHRGRQSKFQPWRKR